MSPCLCQSFFVCSLETRYGNMHASLLAEEDSRFVAHLAGNYAREQIDWFRANRLGSLQIAAGRQTTDWPQ